ncbi:MAG: hypothetical protein COB04_01885 [Gammaproteobacteria bacterium]|nr:MAG: hypothetical protein COB04_01885 [Gammaproteobacteria bacterium]
MAMIDVNSDHNAPAPSGGDWYLYFHQEVFYAFRYELFSELKQSVHLTPVPGSIELVLGVMNVDDDILTVLNIPKLIGCCSASLAALQLVIVAEVEGQKIGIPATHVVGKVNESEFRFESSDLKTTRSSFVHQLVCRENQPVTLLALDKILHNEVEKEVFNGALFLEL